MNAVTRYNCEFCGKDFRTSNRHKCKYDPQMKNCFTCKHNKEFVEFETYVYYGYSEGHERKNVGVNCDKGNYEPEDNEHAHAKFLSGNLNCKDYECSGGKWFENGHYKQKTARNEAEFEI